MKRLLTSLALMGGVLGMASVSSAQNVAEVRIFFTDLGSGFSFGSADSNNDGFYDSSSIPTLGSLPTTNPTFALTQGQMVNLGIWVLPVRGNFTGDYFLTAGALDVLGQTGNAGLRAGSSWYVDSVMRDPSNNLGSATAPSQGTGSGSSNMPAGDNPFRLMNPGGYSGANGFSTAPGTAGNPSLDGAAYFFGALKIMVPATANANDMLQIWLATAGTTRKWTSNSTNAGTNFTMGFGFDAGGNNEFARYDLTTTQINASATGEQASLLADAKITVVPEPATIGLLSLGLLGLRRRRTA